MVVITVIKHKNMARDTGTPDTASNRGELGRTVRKEKKDPKSCYLYVVREAGYVL